MVETRQQHDKTVELFYVCEEHTHCNSLQLLENIADVELLLFRGVIVEHCEQVVLGAIQEILICLGAHGRMVRCSQPFKYTNLACLSGCGIQQREGLHKGRKTFCGFDPVFLSSL